jgi:transposase-like protein
MKQYSEELQAALVEKMLPPQNVPVGQLARETGIPKDTLYTWRAKYRQASEVSVPAHDRPPERLQHRGQVCRGVGDRRAE